MSKKWLIRLLLLDLLLVIAHIIWGDKVYILNLDYERTIPAYYSGLKLVFIAAVSFFIFNFLANKRKEKPVWLLLSLFFVILAFDEISELHENLGDFFLELTNNLNIFQQASFMWLIFLSPIIIGVLVLLFYFLHSLRGQKSFPYILTGIIAFMLVIAAEFFGGMIIKSQPNIYQGVIIFEEFMEKVGASFFVAGLLLIFNQRFEKKFTPRVDNS